MVGEGAAVPWRVAAGCVIVRVRVTPKSSKDGVDGIEPSSEGPALRLRVRAVPADGEANAAVAKVFAEWLDVPKRSVSISSGLKSRLKSLSIAGDPVDLSARLAERLAAGFDEQKTGDQNNKTS